MIVLKVHKSQKHVGSMPLFQALFVDGAIYYSVFVLTFIIDVIASTSTEVGVLDLYHVR